MRKRLLRLLQTNLISIKPNWRLHKILILILYPEFRKDKFLDLIHLFFPIIKMVFSILTILLLIFTSGYLLKAEMVKSKIKSLNESKETINKLNHQLDSVSLEKKELQRVTISRDYWNWKIITESKIGYISNFKSLPDDVFFEAINQCDKLKIPYKIFFRVMQRESRFLFVSNKGGSGAFGYMQVMPQTFGRWQKKLNLKGGHNQINNIIVAANLISSIRDFWKTKKSGTEVWVWTLAEYACGRKCLLSGVIPEDVLMGVREILK